MFALEGEPARRLFSGTRKTVFGLFLAEVSLIGVGTKSLTPRPAGALIFVRLEISDVLGKTLPRYVSLEALVVVLKIGSTEVKSVRYLEARMGEDRSVTFEDFSNLPSALRVDGGKGKTLLVINGVSKNAIS